MAVNEGLTVFNLIDGVVDEFNDETGIDTPENSNAVYDSSSDFYSNQSLGPVPSPQVQRTSITSTGPSTYNVEPTIQTVNVNPNINTGGINKYSSGKVGMVGMTDARVEMALAQLVNSKNFLQAMNGNIPMDFIQPGSPSGPTVSIGSTGGTDIT